MPEESKDENPFQPTGEQQDLRTHNIDPSALLKLLDEWMQGDETEQRETFEELRRGLDADRPAGYKLFS